MGGGGCSSIGLFDILIIGGLLYLGYRMLNRRRQEAYQTSDLGGGRRKHPGILADAGTGSGAGF